MAKKFFPFILFFLLFVNLTIADSISTEIVNDQISPYEAAVYKITIFNEKNISDKYTIICRDVSWAVQTEPLTDYTTGVIIPPYSNYTFNLFAKPRQEKPFVFGKRSFQIDFVSEYTKRAQTAILSADIRQDLIKGPADIDISLLMPEVLNPTKPNSIKIFLKNKNLLNISNITIKLESRLFEKYTTIGLLPEEEKAVEFSVEVEKGTAPQSDTATLTVYYSNQTLKTIRKEYSVGAVGSFKTEKSVNESFLKKITTITYTNEGNSEATERALIETKLFERIFTSTTPKTQVIKIDNIPYYTKNITLKPGEKTQIIVSTNYTPLIYIFVLLVILVFLYLTFRVPIIVVKEAKDIIVEEGGIKEVSVNIKIKNRSKKTVHNVKVTDRIPSITIAELRKSDALRPDKTYHYAEGIVLQYNLNKMEPGEIRFITYHLKTKLGVVGNLRLKPVIVQYNSGKKTFSNPVDVYSP
ncbi:MAG: hypothetical protein QXG86_00725 [Candidatus Woesearchaeota archaeon]